MSAQTSMSHTLSLDNDTEPSQSKPTTIFSFTKLLTCVLTGGLILGLVLPKNQNLTSPTWQMLSSIIGYTYFLAWSTSFYPQIVLNYERRLGSLKIL